MDKVDTETRSRIMSSVRSKGNKSTENRLRAYLAQGGLKGWTLQGNHVIGKPDFVFAKNKIAVFVDGCFWHGCKQHLRLPKSRREYWNHKIKGNAKRDKLITNQLTEQGWAVLRFWEHEVKQHPLKVIRRIRRNVTNIP